MKFSFHSFLEGLKVVNVIELMIALLRSKLIVREFSESFYFELKSSILLWRLRNFCFRQLT